MNPVKQKHSLVLDIGTSGIKALVFDSDYQVVSLAHKDLKSKHPKKNWVEQNPNDYLKLSKQVLRLALKQSGLNSKDFIGLGITNQRETTVMWDKITGIPVYPAIVWEDKRTAEFCAKLKRKHNKIIENKTGLELDPYFSASKIWWILENVTKAKKIADKNQLLFGTVDSWILWHFLCDKKHVTDMTNASRTLLYNVRKLSWDSELLDIFNIPKSVLPKVKRSRANFGIIKKNVFGISLPVKAICGDQQSSAFAAGNHKGNTKVTYGTGTFIAYNLGTKFKIHKPLFTMLMPSRKTPRYALEGKIESSAARVSRVLNKPKELEKVATSIATDVNKYLKKLPSRPKKIYVDGGITQYEHLVDIQSRISKIPVLRQTTYHGTALGIAKLINTAV